MPIFKDFNKYDTPYFRHVELSFSLIFNSPNKERWFCRVWRKLDERKPFQKDYGWAYGKNKFAAYRKAVADLNS